MSIAFNAPCNSLSFGNVSVNLLREMYKKNMDVSFFPIGDSIDLNAFDKLDPDFKEWIFSLAKKRLTSLKNDVPSLKLWHINGSEQRLTPKQILFTFYELDSPTDEEVNLVNLQDHTIFSSSYSYNKFKKLGCPNISYVPIGFDEDFFETKKEYLKDTIHFGLIGKWEKRKHSAKILKAWAARFGNNYDYQLTCCITNPFLKLDQMNQLIAQTLDGEKYGNINFLPFLNTNSEVNDLTNSIDIDLSGLSGAEGWNLPSFNATCLGKWSIVLNATSHKDWATKKNCILVEPEGKESAVDGLFFKPDQPFNQGSIYSLSDTAINKALDISLQKAKTKNAEGVKLRKKFSYSKTLSSIISKIDVI